MGVKRTQAEKNGKFGSPYTETSTKRFGDKRYCKKCQSKLKMKPEICWILTNKERGTLARRVEWTVNFKGAEVEKSKKRLKRTVEN